MNYGVPKVFTPRSRNISDMSVLKHAGSQMFQNKTDYMRGSMLSNMPTAVTPHTERYGVTPYLTNSGSVHDSLLNLEYKLQNKGKYSSGFSPHFFKQVKDAEDYVANMNMLSAPLSDNPYSISAMYNRKDVDSDVDFFVRQANNFDILFKKTWNLLEKMKFKLDSEPDNNYASIAMEESVNGAIYVLQWEDEEMYQASKKVLANENELKTMLKRLPEPTLLFQTRHPQLQELIQFRIDLEN